MFTFYIAAPIARRVMLDPALPDNPSFTETREAIRRAIAAEDEARAKTAEALQTRAPTAGAYFRG